LILHKNVFLIGFMGAGKTTIGKKLALRLGLNFLDTDKFIEIRYKTSVNDLIQDRGMDVFRMIEHEVLKELISYKNYIFATGGGLPCFYENMKLINSNGISIYIQHEPKMLLNRLINSKKKRILIQDKNEDELLRYIELTLNEREFFYKKAHFSISGKNLNFNDFVNILNNL